MNGHVIGVDWGSSNRRAYLLAADGSLIARREDAAGVLSQRPADFAASLLDFIGDWRRDTGAQTWLSGMIGGRDGWLEVPYLQAPLALADIRAGALACPGLQPAVRILPGICQRPPPGPADVMRGEETQLLGAWSLAGRDGWYVLPGTHSKWVRLESGRVLRFHTFMTGELFARLREKGALASVAGGEADDEAAFAAGVALARGTPLAAALFGIRAGALLGSHPQAQAASRLSGLLISAEWEAAGRLGCLDQGTPTLIGEPRLAAWYALAGREYGIQTRGLEADACYRRALLHCLDA
jgi:2-dehydro-3-deoxygalactonokinase